MGIYDLNMYSGISRMLYGEVKPININRRRYIYLEGLIKFLRLYAINELGSNAEIDIPMAAAYVFSAGFDGAGVKEFHSVNKVYEHITMMIYAGMPIWRFLKLSDHQLKLLNDMEAERIENEKKRIIDKYKCFSCEYFDFHITPYGDIMRCNRSDRKFGYHERSINPFKFTECDSWKSGEVKDVIPFISVGLSSKVVDEVEKATTEINNPERDGLLDLGRVMGGKKGYTDIEKERVRCQLFSYLLEFMEVYAQSEYGNAYEANIPNIAKYIFEHKDLVEHKLPTDINKWIEDQIIDNPIWAKKFVKKVTV